MQQDLPHSNKRLGNHEKEFLIEDLKRRNLEKERFYMDDGFGTNWFSSSDALGKAMYRMQKNLKIAGEAKRTHGTRATLLTDLCKENPLPCTTTSAKC